jgi:Uma2 family endonuclease
MARYLCNCFIAYLERGQMGDAVNAPYRVRLRPGVFREPDVVVYLQEHLDRFGERFGEGADLVVEIVSEGKANRERDLEIKPADYAAAGVAEYWIVDPQEQEIQVLTLVDGSYQQHGRFSVGQEATSVLLPDFRVHVRDVLAVGSAL